MRESYARPTPGGAAAVPAAVDAGRLERATPPALRSTLVWSEHCTECAMPACYSSCDLYHPRHDLHCRRFAADLTAAPAGGSGGEWMTVRFRRWGRLQAEGIPSLFRPRRAARIEALDRRLGRGIVFGSDQEGETGQGRQLGQSRRANIGRGQDDQGHGAHQSP
ncbi:MAG: hypothetical protein QF410_09770, partial [Planctomycetota bacterium]|nr:hypothetical protein [Planctomycetota bacterium]